MTIIATCGHEIFMIDEIYEIKRKSHNREGERIVSHQIACMICQGKYRRWGELLDTEEEEQAWLYGKEE